VAKARLKQGEFSHIFRGRRYRVALTSALRDRYGDCDPPWQPNKTIRLLTSLSERRLLETALDEGLHACDWDIDNDMVDEIAHSLAGFLLKLGFRHLPQESYGSRENGRE